MRFISYTKERYFYSGQGRANKYELTFVVLKGNKNYNRGDIIIEILQDYAVKEYRVKKKLGSTFNVIRDNYPLCWHIYF